MGNVSFKPLVCKCGAVCVRKSNRQQYCEACQKAIANERCKDYHHIDENRENNHESNLEKLCKKCHQKHHLVRDEFGRFVKSHKV